MNAEDCNLGVVEGVGLFLGVCLLKLLVCNLSDGTLNLGSV